MSRSEPPRSRRTVVIFLLGVPALAFAVVAFLLGGWRAWVPGAGMTPVVETTMSVYFSPHQDDEVISMGAFLAADVEAGKDVRLVFLGDGHSSNGRKGLCQQQSICLTPQGQSEARRREALRSARAFGIPDSKVEFLDLPEAGFTKGMMDTVLDRYVDEFGDDATYNVTSWLDKHPDHRVLGAALDDRCGTRRNCRFFMSPFYVPDTPVSQSTAPRLPLGLWHTDRSGRVTAAAAAYLEQDLDQGLYGIGGRYSVPGSLRFLQSERRNLGHLGSGFFRWRRDRTAAQSWSREPLARTTNAPLAQEVDAISSTGGRVRLEPLGIQQQGGRFDYRMPRGAPSTAAPALGGELVSLPLDSDDDGALDVLVKASSGRVSRQALTDHDAGSELTPVGSVGADDLLAVAPSSQGPELFIWSASRRVLTTHDLREPGTPPTGTVRGVDLPTGATSWAVLPGDRAEPRTAAVVTRDGHLHRLRIKGSSVTREMLTVSLAPGTRLLGTGQLDGFDGHDVLAVLGDRAWLVQDVAHAARVVPIQLPAGFHVLGA